MVKSYMGCCAATFSIHSRVCYSKNHHLFSRSSRFLMVFWMVFCAFSFHFSRFLCLFPRWSHRIFRIFLKGIRAARRRTKVPPRPPEKALRWRRNVARADDWRVFFPGVGLAVGVYDSLWFTMFRIQTRIFSHYVTMFRIHYVTMLGFTLW